MELLVRSFGFYSVAFLGIILLRYFLVAGGVFFFFWKFGYPGGAHPDRQSSLHAWRLIRHDIKLAMLSTGIFALFAAFIMSAYALGLTRLYDQPQQYGIWYIIASYIAILLLQDTYFYFTHRLFHHPTIFRWVHQGHHQSRYPTPWTSFAFDPLEAVVHALFLGGVVFILPLHFITLIAIATTMTIWAVINHLELDRLSPSFPHYWLGDWMIGPAHHSRHHRQYKVNYGLYFTFWDRLLNTEDNANATAKR
jgi:Delta7-sterol 5-desaturase